MEPDPASETEQKGPRLLRVLKIFGPGIVTGAADDDPSGIATYSQTGAQFGFGQLWTSLYQIPLLLAVQEACARIGAATGKGLAERLILNGPTALGRLEQDFAGSRRLALGPKMAAPVRNGATGASVGGSPRGSASARRKAGAGLERALRLRQSNSTQARTAVS
ncbi:MAG: divalent metal cation transporter [Sphingomonas sp.]|uniref:divalent metal cation transporter n=1 Tax=Sphingomonas sp. TaxID=28214 RepID=UPI001AD209C4|nr:divalent metal cation transporter [Sphingomonas sp.]